MDHSRERGASTCVIASALAAAGRARSAVRKKVYFTHGRIGGHPDMATISCTVLDTDRVPARERFDFWRDALSATHEATLPHDSDPAKFSAFARGWNLGPS